MSYIQYPPMDPKNLVETSLDLRSLHRVGIYSNTAHILKVGSVNGRITCYYGYSDSYLNIGFNNESDSDQFYDNYADAYGIKFSISGNLYIPKMT